MAIDDIATARLGDLMLEEEFLELVRDVPEFSRLLNPKLLRADIESYN
jgi:hypothetical protein